MSKNSQYIESEQKSLKAAFPDVEQRKMYAQNKLKGCRLKNPFIIRVQPNNKYFKAEQKIKFLTFMMEGTTQLAQVNAHIHKKLKLSQTTSLYLTWNSKIINNNQTVSQIAQKGKQLDGIIYLSYADQQPF